MLQQVKTTNSKTNPIGCIQASKVKAEEAVPEAPKRRSVHQVRDLVENFEEGDDKVEDGVAFDE